MTTVPGQGPGHPWMDVALPPRERAERLVAAMDTEQKIAQLHGAMQTVDIYGLTRSAARSADGLDALAAQIQVERHVAAVDELEVPRMRVTNGPVGVGMGDGANSPRATALPMAIALAAGFDPALAREYGALIGAEAATLGQHVLEGPGVCLHRTAIAGRNFEYFSEDPYLTGVLGVEVARAIQGQGVIAMAKHYVLNDQETERFRANVEIAENVMRELYLLPFEMLVKDARIASVMGAYNRVRGTYATENRYTLHTILRDEWGFDGYVQSDFWSCRSAAPALNAGMDLEMPDAKWLNPENVHAGLADTSLEIETIDRALVRRFTQMFRFGQFDRPYAPGEIDASAHGAIARRIGEQTAVLLKNDGGVLPLDPHMATVALLGQAQFVDQACLGGGGSSKVNPLYTVAPLEGLHDIVGELHGSAHVENVTVAADLSNLDDARALARTADAVVIMAGVVATEGNDRSDLRLPNAQDEMITALAGVNPRTVVVLKDSSPVLMPWIDLVPAVLEVWNQGTEDGHVVGALVFGAVNPSGKLPITYPAGELDTLYAGHPERYPGVVGDAGYPELTYSEGLEIGYRWHLAQDITPLFPFGHGLSYTTFDLTDLSVACSGTIGSSVQVAFTVTNTGARSGAEVAQVYLGLPPATGQPPKRLVAFRKIPLLPGQSQRQTLTLDPNATSHPLSVWSDAAHDFVVPSGDFVVHVGTSSTDTPLHATVRLA